MDQPQESMADPSPLPQYPTPPPQPAYQTAMVHEPPPEGELHPFLGLYPRLLLSALSPALLPMVFTIAHLAATRTSSQALGQKLKDGVLDACASLAGGASALQTLPRYLAMQTNREVIRGSRAAVLGVGLGLMYLITAIEKVVIFIVDAYRSLLLCTVELVVNASLDLLIAAVSVISDGLTATMNGIRSMLLGDLENIKSAISAVGGVINNVGQAVDKLTGGDGSENLVDFDFNIPTLSALQDVNVIAPFEDKLRAIDKSMPSLENLKEKMNDLISIPFEKLIKEINETRHELAATLNEAALPVPSLKSLGAESTAELNQSLCQDLDTSFIDDAAKSLYNLATVAVIAMALVVLGGYVFLMFVQWRRWKALRETVELLEDEWALGAERHPGSIPDAWATVAVVENPMIEGTLHKVYKIFRLQPSQRTRTNMRWLLSYLCHPTCLTLLAMAVLGLIFLKAQILALGVIKRHAQASAAEAVSGTTTDLTDRLNSLSAKASAEYARDLNAAVQDLSDNINSQMFGNFVSTTSVTLNTTLVEFYADVEKGISFAFGGTPLHDAINVFVYCILGSKITALEKGLTWIHEHAHISFPSVDDNVIMLDQTSMAELSSPVTAAAVGDGSGDTGAIAQLVKHFQDALETQVMIYGLLLGVWVFLLLVGVGVVVWHSGVKERVRGREGAQEETTCTYDKEALPTHDKSAGARRLGEMISSHLAAASALVARLRSTHDNPDAPESFASIKQRILGNRQALEQRHVSFDTEQRLPAPSSITCASNPFRDDNPFEFDEEPLTPLGMPPPSRPDRTGSIASLPAAEEPYSRRLSTSQLSRPAGDLITSPPRMGLMTFMERRRHA